MNFPTKTRSIIGCPAVIKLCLHQATWSRRSAQAILAFSLACFFAPFTSAQSVNEHVLSTHTSAQLPATLESQGVFGLNDAIRAGEARRRAASGAQTTAPQPLAPEPAYARYPRYQGSIGGVPIRMRLGPKPDERDSVHGEYQFGLSEAALRVAGEYADGTFLMEESDDGTTVTGLWEGQIDARGVVRGEWTDAFDRQRVLPFVLVPISVAVIPPYVQDNTSASNAGAIATPAPIDVPRQPGTPGTTRSRAVGW